MITTLRPLLTTAALLLVLSGLVFWERTLAQRESGARHDSVRIRSFTDISIFDERPFVAIRLDTGDGNTFLYLPDQHGVWRSYNAHGAPAIPSKLAPILDRLINASGYVQSRNPEAGPNYGLEQPSTLRLAFCGENVLTDPDGDGDIIYAVEIGNSIPRTGGSYVRQYGTNDIWNIDDDLRDVLEADTDSPLPPMVDRTLVPEAWPGMRQGLQRIVVEREGELQFEMRHEDRLPSEDAPTPDGPEWEWVISDGEQWSVAHTSQVFAYAMFLLRVEFSGLPGPMRRPELGVDQPNAAIVLESATGERLRLQFGGMTDRGGIAVLNTFTDTLYEIPPTHVDLFFPDKELLLSTEHGTPWHPWVEQRMETQ